jgi:hypothetical protein
MKLALMECGRKLGTYLRKRQAMRRESERRDVFERYIGEIAKAVNAINGADAKKLYEALLIQAKKRTAIADLQLDDEGKAVRDSDPADQEGVIIVESAMSGPGITTSNEPEAQTRISSKTAPGSKLSKSESARLKVAALAKEESQPRLIETDETPRSSRSGKAPKTKAPKRTSPPPAAPEAAAPKPTKPRPVESAPAPDAPAPKPKLRMRLVNGKLVRADDSPGLF